MAITHIILKLMPQIVSEFERRRLDKALLGVASQTPPFPSKMGESRDSNLRPRNLLLCSGLHHSLGAFCCMCVCVFVLGPWCQCCVSQATLAAGQYSCPMLSWGCGAVECSFPSAFFSFWCYPADKAFGRGCNDVKGTTTTSRVKGTRMAPKEKESITMMIPLSSHLPLLYLFIF